jgi:hypothetical protein
MDLIFYIFATEELIPRFSLTKALNRYPVPFPAGVSLMTKRRSQRERSISGLLTRICNVLCTREMSVLWCFYLWKQWAHWQPILVRRYVAGFNEKI